MACTDWRVPMAILRQRPTHQGAWVLDPKPGVALRRTAGHLIRLPFDRAPAGACSNEAPGRSETQVPFLGENQIGEDHARSCTVACASFGIGSFSLMARSVLHRAVGISRTLA
jgi:hypothetical protein